MHLARIGQKIFPAIIRDRVILSDDPAELRLSKSLLVTTSLLIVAAGFIWGFL